MSEKAASETYVDKQLFRSGAFAIGFFLGALLVTVLWVNWNSALEHGKREALKLVEGKE